MATYVNDLRLKEIATGDESGTWGTSTNTNLELIGEALSFGTEAITTNADTHTTTVADGASDPGRAMYLKYTGTLDSTCTITIAPNTMSRMQFIENGTSGSQDIIISQGSGANVTIPAGDVKAVYLDGAGSGAAVVDAFTDLNLAGTTKMAGFTSSVASTITTADNTDTLSLISTDADANAGPNLRMYRNSGSPADDDFLGEVQFEGRNDNSEDVIYGQILTRIRDASDGTEDAQLTLKTMVAGTARNRLEFNEGEAVFNDDSVDVNFRVESDGNANMLFVDAGQDRVGIGNAAPSVFLHVSNDGSGEADVARFSRTNSSDVGFLDIGIDPDNDLAIFDASGSSSQSIVFRSGGTERVRFASSGNVGIGESSPAAPLHVEHSSGTAYNGAAEITESLIVSNKAGTDDSGVNNVASIGLHVADGATSQGFINYVRTANNKGDFTFSQRTGGSSYAEAMRIASSGNVGIGTTDFNDMGSSSYKGLKVGGATFQDSGGGNGSATHILNNSYVGSGNNFYLDGGGAASGIQLTSGDINFFTFDGSGGSADAQVSFTSRLHIAETGTVGIGTTSPAFSSGSGLEIERDGPATLRLTDLGSGNKFFEIFVDDATGNHLKGLSSGLPMIFSVINSEAMRIDTAGQLRINNTSTIGSNDEGVLHLLGKAAHTVCKMKVTSNSQRYIHFFDASNNDAGEIQNGGGASTIYATSSDYRMKENIRPMENGLDRVAQLNPVKFTWKHYGVEQEGFIAHEAQEVFPEAVTGEKDGIDKYGKPQMQAMDYGKITPLLVKAIQEQQEQIEQLKKQIETLQ